MKISNVPNMFCYLLEEIRNLKLPLVIFGAGNHGRVFIRTFQRYGISVECFCDNNPEKQKCKF